jgi:hypothetical protein
MEHRWARFKQMTLEPDAKLSLGVGGCVTVEGANVQERAAAVEPHKGLKVLIGLPIREHDHRFKI